MSRLRSLASAPRRISGIVLAAMTAAPLVAIATPMTAQTMRPPSSGRTLTLRDVLDSTLARHPLAEAARARVRAASGARTTARAFGNPVLSYDVENAPFPGGSPIVGMPRETMATAMLPLESLFQRWPRSRRADADVRAAEADAVGARQQLALDATRAYVRLALAQVSVDVARDLMAWLDSVVVYNKTRFEQGVAAEADLIRTELERDRAAAEATMHEANQARARAELAAFVGDSGFTPADLVVAIDEEPLRLPPFDASVLAAPPDVARADLSRRPDVRAARERLTASDASVTSERTMIVRQLAATFGAKWTEGTTSMVAGLSMPLPIFDPNRGEIQRAAADRDAASFELAARERAARAELAGAYEAARLLTDRVTLLARGADGRPSFLARADEARRIALGAYREGAVSLLQVIDAARAWGDSRRAFYETLFAQHESVALLLVARGDDLLTELPALASRGQANQR